MIIMKMTAQSMMAIVMVSMIFHVMMSMKMRIIIIEIVR